MRDGATVGTVFKFPKDMGVSNTSVGPGPESDDLPLPPRLQGTLERFRERLWSIKIAEGALAGVLGLGVSYLFVFVLDRFIDTPTWLRASLLIAGFAFPALGLPLLWHRWVWRQRTLGDAARYLKRRYPKIGDELLGIVELAHHHPGDQSQTLITAAMRQVDERIGDRDFSDAVSTRRYRHRLCGTLVVLAVAVLLLTLVSDAAKNALTRWVSPWKSVDRYTFAQLEDVPEKLVVPYAEPFSLESGLARTTEWKPDQASLQLPGKTRLASPREADRYAFTVPPQKETGTLSLRVGDARERIDLAPLPRPELTALEAIIRLPDYLRYESDPVVPVRGNALKLVEGATATIRGTTTRELASAESDGTSARIEGASFFTEALTVTEPQTRRFSWKDIHGLEAKSPLELGLMPVPDEAPGIQAHQVEAKRMVLEDELVTFDVRAKDDFGLREVGLEWRLASDGKSAAASLTGEKPVAAGAPEKTSIDVRGTFSAKREGIRPGTYQVRAFATDFLPNRERTYSPAFLLEILSPEEHARWLTEEFAKWFRNARETYEREQQLHESNLALRELTPQELDEPENRRRLQDQSSAESANARRLDALTLAGRGLVGEATKNPEFDAERLERWAEMNRALEQIARERMPGVADLLQQASRAPGTHPAGTEEKTPDKPIETVPPPPSSPTLSDGEKGLVPEKKEAKGGDGASSAPPPLRLPVTTLAAGEEGEAGTDPSPATPAQKTLDRALEEQKELLAEFAKVADELAAILASLEASTFVKRLKAASRKQTELADTLAKTLGSSFGLPRQRVEQQIREVGEAVAKTQEEQSRFVHHIQSDLEAYYQRKQDPIYRKVLEQMKERSVVPGLRLIGEETLVNRGGRSVVASEYWADTLDRWAEELVAAAPDQPSQGGQQGEQKSLPPELVLHIMKVLQEEMQLRDETREMEETRPAFAPDVYASKVRPLEDIQTDLRERIDRVVEDIRKLPEAADFEREIMLLSLVSDTMRQAHAVLTRPDTGPEAIAFETEVIELLLQSKRQQSGGGGGGGGANQQNPSGGSGGEGKGSALSDIGPQGTPKESAPVLDREVEQSTGKAGRELPEEFRRGLDTYFNQLESN